MAARMIVNRMQLEWSTIQFSQSQYIVCEDAQQLAVSIVRTGSLNHSAAVTVRLKSLTAKESTDFKNKSDSTVEFPPGIIKYYYEGTAVRVKQSFGLCILTCSWLFSTKAQSR